MKKLLLISSALLLGLVWSCQKDIPLTEDLTSAAGSLSLAASGECITFDDGSFNAGDLVTEAYSVSGMGPVLIDGFNPLLGAGVNAAMIFDSGSPSGSDPDLGTPNEVFGGPGIGIGGEGGVYVNDMSLGNLLIISEDLDSADPDDADEIGAKFHFDFSSCGPATLHSITIIDVDGESNDAEVILYDDGMSVLSTTPLPETGDNGVAFIDLGGVSGVLFIDVLLNGSGGVDNICFEKDSVPPPPDGCVRSKGYWKNHAGFGPQADEITPLLPITLGDPGGEYTITVNNAAMAYDILCQNVYCDASNGMTKLYAQLLAAKLNIASGADASCISWELEKADYLIGIHACPWYNKATDANQHNVNMLKDKLDDYNNGDLSCAPYCDEEEEE